MSLPMVATLGAWDYEGHRLVNQLALDALPTNFPVFVQTPAARERIAFLGGEADRWRNSPDLSFKHASSPDHYIDFEELGVVGLEAKSLSPFRYEFAAQFAQAREAADKLPPIDLLKNSDRTREWAGFLPWAIVEQQAKLRSAFSYLRAFEKFGGTPDEIANAQQNTIYLLGVMGHFVADGSQPLHTTVHHHGWVGPNPHSYPTNASIHQWIDGGFIKRAGLKASALSPRMRPAKALMPVAAGGLSTNLFPVVTGWLLEQHRQVEPLYQLEKSGGFSGRGEVVPEEGRQFISTQLVRAAQMLSDLWLTADEQAPEDTFLRDLLLKRERAGNGGTRPQNASGIAK
jgi:hypothetical protein